MLFYILLICIIAVCSAVTTHPSCSSIVCGFIPTVKVATTGLCSNAILTIVNLYNTCCASYTGDNATITYTQVICDVNASSQFDETKFD